ncbi:MAG: hypothetical protein DRR06_12080 [Gammaproteobacteria bacterium]|nr:MAG: hypothetical protein DRR06_12080 [Gammaproteobacteria bacterium]RLA51103.1 MAG: hypothetical protein DRR42_11260 [Gammaproteobacteria bacterium]
MVNNKQTVVLNTRKLLGFKLLGTSVTKSSAKVGKSPPVTIGKEGNGKSFLVSKMGKAGSKVGKIT